MSRYYVPDNCLGTAPETNEVTGEVYPHYEVVLASEYDMLRAEVERLTRERDLFQTNAKAQHDSHEVTMHALANVRQQLAASQARVRELEQQPGFRTMVDYMLIEQERDRLRTALEACHAFIEKNALSNDTTFLWLSDVIQQALRGAGEEPGA